MSQKKVTVIGGGPGGYVAAIRAAQLGAAVSLVEKDSLGGTCLNVGCIPTKALLNSAHTFHDAGNATEIGIEATPSLNWENVQIHKRKVIDRLVGGVGGLMRANHIQVIEGKASFLDESTICVVKASGEKLIHQSDCFIIATGSIPFVPQIPGIDSAGCIDSTEALELDHVPSTMLVIGGGVIGIELATAYHYFGTAVTVVEMAEHILPNTDEEISERLEYEMKSSGINIMTGAKVLSIERDVCMTSCKVQSSKGEVELQAETVLACIGRKPRFSELHLEKAGVHHERVIQVNNCMQTNVPHIFAVGDCNGLLMLAHAASEQGVVAAENCMGGDSKFSTDGCPSCVYSMPEIASVGLTEKQLIEQGIPYRVGRFPATANGRSLIMRQDTGLVKMLVGEKYGEIIGVHLYGEQATELIAEAVLAIKTETTADELSETIHAHPTFSECIHEAALASLGRAIHVVNKK